jgi:hypothetical protein
MENMCKDNLEISLAFNEQKSFDNCLFLLLQSLYLI